MNQGFLYILKSLKNNSYYIGSTKNLNRRFQYHKTGLVKATKHSRPLELVFHKRFDTLLEARRAEYKLKKLKSRDVIEKILRDNVLLLAGT